MKIKHSTFYARNEVVGYMCDYSLGLNAKLTPYLNDGIVCVGVGAAFRAILGGLKAPDGFLQKIGLAGLLFKRSERTCGSNSCGIWNMYVTL